MAKAKTKAIDLSIKDLIGKITVETPPSERVTKLYAALSDHLRTRREVSDFRISMPRDSHKHCESIDVTVITKEDVTLTYEIVAGSDHLFHLRENVV